MLHSTGKPLLNSRIRKNRPIKAIERFLVLTLDKQPTKCYNTDSANKQSHRRCPDGNPNTSHNQSDAVTSADLVRQLLRAYIIPRFYSKVKPFSSCFQHPDWRACFIPAHHTGCYAMQPAWSTLTIENTLIDGSLLTVERAMTQPCPISDPTLVFAEGREPKVDTSINFSVSRAAKGQLLGNTIPQNANYRQSISKWVWTAIIMQKIVNRASCY